MHGTIETEIVDGGSSGEVAADLRDVGILSVAGVEQQVGHAETKGRVVR